MKTKVALSSLVLGLILTPVAVFAGDVEDLSAILDNFLAHAGELAAHERFWADDLVYTSSRGTRTAKAEIMASFENQHFLAGLGQIGGTDETVVPGTDDNRVDLLAHQDLFLKRFQIPIVLDQPGGEIVEQLRMRRQFALRTKLFAGFDNSHTKDLFPVTIGDHASG